MAFLIRIIFCKNRLLLTFFKKENRQLGGNGPGSFLPTLMPDQGPKIAKIKVSIGTYKRSLYLQGHQGRNKTSAREKKTEFKNL